MMALRMAENPREERKLYFSIQERRNLYLTRQVRVRPLATLGYESVGR